MTTVALGTPAYFWKCYTGPKGPHLGHRTYYTQTGVPAKAETNHSIHPRVVGARTMFTKSNTAKPRREQRGTNPYAVPMAKFRARGK